MSSGESKRAKPRRLQTELESDKAEKCVAQKPSRTCQAPSDGALSAVSALAQ